MTALRFHKLSHSSERCHVTGCTRSGKYAVTLCGYPIPSSNPLAIEGGRTLVCSRCKNKQVKEWEDADAPFRGYESARKAIESPSKPERVHAIFELRELGCAAKDVAALKKVAA